MMQPLTAIRTALAITLGTAVSSCDFAEVLETGEIFSVILRNGHSGEEARNIHTVIKVESPSYYVANPPVVEWNGTSLVCLGW